MTRPHNFSYTTDSQGEITSLRINGVAWLPLHEANSMARGARQHAEQQLAVLTHWKAEATALLAEWEQIWQALGSPGGLGESKARASRAKAAELMAGDES